jgi:hypothetical protein
LCRHWIKKKKPLSMIISKQQSADGTCPEDNRKLNRFEIESDEQWEQWLLPETVAIGSRSIQSQARVISRLLLEYNHGWSCKQSVVYAYLHFKCNDSWLYDQKTASKEDLQTFYSTHIPTGRTPDNKDFHLKYFIASKDGYYYWKQCRIYIFVYTRRKRLSIPWYIKTW